MTPRETEAYARIVIDDLLQQAGWDPSDKSMVATEAPAVLPERPDPLVDRLGARPFETHAPAYDLVAAAGDFGPDRLVGKEGDESCEGPSQDSPRRYVSSPTGGGIRHGTDVADPKKLADHEARLFCNLVREYIRYLLAAHERQDQGPS